MAGPTGFEPAISSVTGRHVRPLHHEPSPILCLLCEQKTLLFCSQLLPQQLSRLFVERIPSFNEYWLQFTSKRNTNELAISYHSKGLKTTPTLSIYQSGSLIYSLYGRLSFISLITGAKSLSLKIMCAPRAPFPFFSKFLTISNAYPFSYGTIITSEFCPS